jgi:hypothetical protein
MVAVQVAGTAGDEDLAASAAAYEAETGYGLVLHGELSWPLAITEPGPREAFLPAPDDLPLAGPRLDATTALATIRAAFAAAQVPLYNVGQKGNQIEVAFITSAMGRRHTALLAQVAEQVGWPVRAATQPQQGAVIDAVRGIVTRRLARGPGIHTAEARVRVRLALGEQADPAEVERWQQAVWEATGYALEVEALHGLPVMAPAAPSVF